MENPTKMGDGAPRRRRRTPETRKQEIMQAAVTLFAERGYERTTTKEIAHAAQISEGTIYKYFASKQEILFAFLAEEVIAPLPALLDVSGKTPEEVLHTVLRDRFLLWQKNHDLLKVVFSEALFNPELARMAYDKMLGPGTHLVEQYLTQRMRRGEFRAMNTRFVSRAMVGHIFAQFIMWDVLLPAEERLPQEVLIDELTQLFLLGVQTRVKA